MIREIIEKLCIEASEVGFDIEPEDVHFDDSRAWKLCIDGSTIGVSARYFGAYRDYLGGGIRGPIHNNGREEDKTVGLGLAFERALISIEEELASSSDYDEEVFI